MKRSPSSLRKVGSQQAFPVVIQPDTSGGFWASCPSLAGCYSQGETIEETLKNVREAIELCLADAPKKTRRASSNDVSVHLVTV